MRSDRRVRERELRHARDQHRHVPLHDHGAHLPQRPAQEGQRAAAAGRALERPGGASPPGSSTVSFRTRSSSRRSSPTGPAELAAKSPVIMRLGKEAMRRQLDMPLDDALDYLRAQLTLAMSTEDIVEGVTAFFEKRDPVWKRTLMSTQESTSLLRPLVEDLHARREQHPAGRGRGEDRPAARARKAHRPRADSAADRRGHVRRARHPRQTALLPARDGRRRGARRRCHHRLRQGRRAPDGGVRLRLHGDGGLDGHDRRAQGRRACASSR